MKQESIQAAAQALYKARTERAPIAPISNTFGIQDLETAYKVSEVNCRRRIAAGARVVGMKVGLTSRSVQQQLGVDQPDFGVLMDDMCILNGGVVPANRLIQPKVEAEVAFVLGRDLCAEKPSWGQFLASVAYALPAIEVVDSAIADWKITLADTVADNASCGVFVLGDQPFGIDWVALHQLGMQLSKNDTVVSIGAGAACLGHPLRAAYWLACTMATRGEQLKEGAIVLSGALGPMVPVNPGDTVRADLGALGTVGFLYSQEDA